MKKSTIPPFILAVIFAIVFAFSTQAYNTNSRLVNVRYDSGAGCPTCTLIDPGSEYICTTTQNFLDPRCQCTVGGLTLAATDASDTSSPCAPLWKNTL